MTSSSTPRRTRRPASSSPNESPLRLGFAVKVLGAEDLKSNDARRWQQSPHLRVSLECLQRIFDYLARQNIRMYRMSSDIAPYVTHPKMPQFHRQIRECARELRALGRRAREVDLRLSFHPSQFIVLNSPDPVLVQKSIADLAAQTEMLDRMELGPEAVVVVHAGGTYGDVKAGRERWIATHRKLPAAIRRRLVLENDDARYSAGDVLKIHRATGVPLIFDHQHFWCHNPEQLELLPTVKKFLHTWPHDVRPKLHFSSPRTEMRALQRKDRKAGK
ncbi:MAG TPA: UV DNA damage repair endonuclease UvsE, partial [Chthoniobacterales bacterium]